MVEPIDYQNQVGQVRLLMGDVDPTGLLLTGDQIRGLLAITNGNTKRAAARGLRVIAASEVLISKKITTQDLSTDGPAVAAELRAQAKDLEKQADDEEAKTEATNAYAGFVPNTGPRHREGEERCRW
ncbi:hypothetical protein ACIGDM_00980 [Rothia koreensis]|uniref:hypothetical protein n=1 Tax=Rothia koreensis TaxID=592378 RepID=UPI0037C5089C